MGTSKIYLLIAFAITLVCCKKWDDYKKYTDTGEKIYPYAAAGVKSYPGNQRVLLSWVHGIDTRIKTYTIYWNNGADSLIVNATTLKAGDTVKQYITNLAEANYSFIIYSKDAEGNRSVPSPAPSVNVYGPKYKASLLNRAVNSVSYSGTTQLLTVKWNVPDTINLGTQIWYTNTLGEAKILTIEASQNTSEFSWQVGSKIYYQSQYKPTAQAIDNFTVPNKDSITIKYVPVPKTAWKKINLTNDIAANAYGTSLSWIWDGKSGGYPQIYHSSGGSLPHHFTIDLGAQYTLNKVEEIGRTDCACHNVTRFEVWGIADVTGAATTLPADDAGWKQESLNKGWILLKEVVRSDNGVEPFNTTLPDGLPPVRFIRIRVLETLDGNIESHMSELSFWYQP